MHSLDLQIAETTNKCTLIKVHLLVAYTFYKTDKVIWYKTEEHLLIKLTKMSQ